MDLLNGEIRSVKYWIESSYKDRSGKSNRCFEVTKLGCEFLAHKSTGKKGNLFTARYMEKFEEMKAQLEETKPKLPTSYKEALIALVKEIEEKEKLESDLSRLTHDAKLYNTTEIAKELGFRSAIQLNKNLQERKIQYKSNGTWVLCARYAECGYVSIKQNELENGKIVYDRKWTGKGRNWLINEVYNTPVIE